MRSAGYVDDARVARERARTLAERGLGDAAIRADLERRGVSKELVGRATASLEPEGARAARLVRSLGNEARAARTLARKGFEPDSIERAIGAVAEEG